MDKIENKNNNVSQPEEITTEKESSILTTDGMVAVAESSNDNKTEEGKFCVKCGAGLMYDQAYCPKCGHRVGAKLETSKGAEKKMLNKRLVSIVTGVAVIVVASIVIFAIARGVQAKGITLNKDTLTVKAGETAKLTFTINPDDTKDKTANWESSNDSIATVGDGTITAYNEGDCTITVSTKNGKTDTCSITVIAAGPDLQAIYDSSCDSSYASVASDGSYLSIDTNPLNIEEYTEQDAINAIFAVNEALGLPESVISKMGSTRSLDGMQSYKGAGVEVSWTYHPDNGLEVQYSLTD